MNASSLGKAQCVALLGLLLLAACATTVAIDGRFPARYSEVSSIRKLMIGRFDGSGGGDFANVLESHLAAATFDGQRYFTVTPAGGGGRVDGSRAAAAGRAVGAQGVVFGAVSADFNTERYQGQESRCVRREGDKCRQYQSFPITCWRRTVQLTAMPRMVNAANGQIVYSAQKSASRQTRWCQNGSQTNSDQMLAAQARDQIIEDIRRDIGPYNAVLNAALKTMSEGLSGDAKAQFSAAVKFASSGDMPQACKRWEAVNAAQPNNPPTLYNLGVCAESSGDYPEAMAFYQQTQDLSGRPDAVVTASLARVRNLMEASGQLAQVQAREEAAAEADRQQRAAAARAEAAAAAKAAKAQKDAQAQAKAAEAKRQQAARDKYGAAAPAILAGKIVLGMTKEQVRAARGAPSAVRRISATEEMWSYGAQRVVFLNGKVTTIR